MVLQPLNGLLQLVLDVVHRADQLEDGLVAQGVLAFGLVVNTQYTQADKLQQEALEARLAHLLELFGHPSAGDFQRLAHGELADALVVGGD